MLTEGGDLRGAGAPNEGEGEIAAGGHDLRSRTAAQGGAILAKGHVAQPVATLDAPVAADEREQAVGVGVAGREAGDQIDGFRRRLRGRAHGADEAGDLGDTGERKIGAQIRIEAGAHGDCARVGAAAAAITRRGGAPGGADRQNRRPVRRADAAGCP